MDDSPMAANSPSPATDMMFSQSNSPGDFARDHSSVSSPEGVASAVKRDPSTPEGADLWSIRPDAILIPQSRDAPHVSLIPDKKKTRAETQIKMTLAMDPLDNVEYIRFPRKTLAKPKHFASDEERRDVESKGAVLQMDVNLVCATAIDNPQDRQRALRRAAGIEEIPRRPEGASVTDLDKEDPSHPQNGGEVLICDGCKERERKRYDRKKKRGDDEAEFSKYENDRVIMINEKEHKKLRDADSGDMAFSPRARQVDFAMRITCYCRHQEEKTPMGYRVIFTFKLNNALLVQHISDVFHITDDHKNKEMSVETLPQSLAIPQYGLHQYPQQSNVVVPMYQFTDNYGLNAYSQPTTPIVSQFTSPISPMDTSFSSAPPQMSQPMPQSLPPSMPPSMNQGMSHTMGQGMNQTMGQAASQSMPTLAQQARQPGAAFPATVSTNNTPYPRHQRGHSNYYDSTPLMSPVSQLGFGETHGLPRPQSLDNFNFTYTPNGTDFQNQYFNSAPPSTGGTPINLSRPASPNWEQGPNKKGKTLRCVYFYVDE
ncbi:hypothetical protein P171DRAFT_455676 [Karstenula rhodostoma CBS 690.94]|uniref:SPT23/MGA2-like DNA-binding domain-containing protein n=1 Tax=Karstenula rhodostoma CBS 690.94 TaxID=1392251 RepID=A0A9P4U9X4_9PLEO|nr:hypothetical protein P171DRAFT_455676 [Karstenula rhodostoma CBS 690.94]